MGFGCLGFGCFRLLILGLPGFGGLWCVCVVDRWVWGEMIDGDCRNTQILGFPE